MYFSGFDNGGEDHALVLKEITLNIEKMMPQPLG